MGNPLLRKSQFGVESSAGTGVTATRQLVGTLILEDDRTRERRDERRASMGGSNTYNDLSYAAIGRYSGECTVAEAPYHFASAMRGDVTPTQPDGTGVPYLWTYTQPLSSIVALQPLTGYAGDNTQALKSPGMFTKKITIRGSAKKPWTIETELLGRKLATGSFASLTQPTTESMLNLLTKLYFDSTFAGIGGTQVATGTAYDFVWVWDSGIEGDFAMDGALDMSDILRGEPTCTLDITGKWASRMVTEFGNWDTNTRRFIRLEHSGSNIETTYYNRARLDGAYTPTAFKPLDEERNGLVLAKATFTAAEDGTSGKKVEATFQNSLSAL